MGFSEIGVVSAIIGVSKNWGLGSENAHLCPKSNHMIKDRNCAEGVEIIETKTNKSSKK